MYTLVTIPVEVVWKILDFIDDKQTWLALLCSCSHLCEIASSQHARSRFQTRCSINELDRDGLTPLLRLIKDRLYCRAEPSSGRASVALTHETAASIDSEIRQLLAARADPTIKDDRYGSSALHLLIMSHIDEHHKIAWVELALEAKCDALDKRHNQYTAFQCAVYRSVDGSAAIIGALLDAIAPRLLACDSVAHAQVHATIRSSMNSVENVATVLHHLATIFAVTPYSIDPTIERHQNYLHLIRASVEQPYRLFKKFSPISQHLLMHYGYRFHASHKMFVALGIEQHMGADAAYLMPPVVAQALENDSYPPSSFTWRVLQAWSDHINRSNNKPQ
jgi:hypothetical protein